MIWRRSQRPLPGEAVVVDPGADPAEIQKVYERGRHDAYERGRKDERARHRRHPVLMTLTFLAAAVGAVMLVVAFREGSFTQGGVVVDKNLSVAAERAEPVVRDAGANAGQALREVGDKAEAGAKDVTN